MTLEEKIKQKGDIIKGAFRAAGVPIPSLDSLRKQVGASALMINKLPVLKKENVKVDTNINESTDNVKVEYTIYFDEKDSYDLNDILPYFEEPHLNVHLIKKVGADNKTILITSEYKRFGGHNIQANLKGAFKKIFENAELKMFDINKRIQEHNSGLNEFFSNVYNAEFRTYEYNKSTFNPF